jgi:hypothetical protein
VLRAKKLKAKKLTTVEMSVPIDVSGNLVKEVRAAFADAAKDGVIDAGDVMRLATFVAGKVRSLKKMSVAQKKGLVLDLLREGVKSVGPRPFGVDERVSEIVVDQLLKGAAVVIDGLFAGQKLWESLFAGLRLCASPAAVVDVVEPVAVAAVAAAVVDLSGAVQSVAEGVVASAAGVGLDLSGVVHSATGVVAGVVAGVASDAAADVSGVLAAVVAKVEEVVLQPVSNPEADSATVKTDTAEPTQSTKESSPQASPEGSPQSPPPSAPDS